MSSTEAQTTQASEQANAPTTDAPVTEKQAPPPPSTEALEKVKSQIEFYFGNHNYYKDKFLRNTCMSDPENYIDIEIILRFQRVRKILGNGVKSGTKEDKHGRTIPVFDKSHLVKAVSEYITEKGSSVVEITDQRIRKKENRAVVPDERIQNKKSVTVFGVNESENLDSITTKIGKGDNWVVAAVRLERSRKEKNFRGIVHIEFDTEAEATAFLESVRDATDNTEGKGADDNTSVGSTLSKVTYPKLVGNELPCKGCVPKEVYVRIAKKKSAEKYKPMEPEGTIMKITVEIPPSTEETKESTKKFDRFDVKAFFTEKLGDGKLKYVDYHFGNSEGYLRFKHEETANEAAAMFPLTIETASGKAVLKEASVLSKEEKNQYWERVFATQRERGKKRPRSHFRGQKMKKAKTTA